MAGRHSTFSIDDTSPIDLPAFADGDTRPIDHRAVRALGALDGMSFADPPGIAEPSARSWLALSACLIAVFMQMVDTTIVNIALPSLSTDLGATSSNQLLVLTVYTLAFACTLMTASRLGELWGRRRVFLGALIGFTVTSVLCGTATGATELIVLRGLQGVSAACASAQTIAIISAMFPRSRHGAVFGLYGATAGIAAMLGPVLGGALISGDVLGLGWRTIFLVNLPLGVVACAMAFRYLPSIRSADHEPLDVVGAVLSSAGLFALIYPLAVGREEGWPTWLLGLLAVSIVLLIAFVVYERRLLRRGGNPLLRLDLFGNRAFAVGATLSLLFFSVFAAFFFAVSITTQFGLGYSALRTGLITLPFAVGAAIGSLTSPFLVNRIGARTLAVGMVFFAVSVAWVALLIDPSARTLDVASVLVPLAIGGIGTGLFVAPLQATILSGTSTATVGSASGSIPTVQQVGASIGLAVIGIFFFNQVADQSVPAVRDGSQVLTQRLTTTEVPGSVQQFVIDEFARCAREQLASARPEVVPPGCAGTASAPSNGTDMRSTIARQAAPAIREAGRDVAAHSFLGAFVVIMWTIAGTALGLALLSLGLRKRPPEMAATSEEIPVVGDHDPSMTSTGRHRLRA
ncbi:DHA2 family efflux MFS transporter permease subunit [Williamsia maris]|uniref:Drug resistance transporter, EmrB/QacA subfamily n=1 Tax=Williamsia maris TaxID=72806 RepID=A0ABT1HKW9_9NOCA|nr:DHA2 family efflux MFS transporter permease subunit [Williamsia maris]MCP2178594.1 drug resistance transporter, EmrB/QacA subfamily [Williamsia maris]